MPSTSEILERTGERTRLILRRIGAGSLAAIAVAVAAAMFLASSLVAPSLIGRRAAVLSALRDPVVDSFVRQVQRVLPERAGDGDIVAAVEGPDGSDADGTEVAEAASVTTAAPEPATSPAETAITSGAASGNDGDAGSGNEGGGHREPDVSLDTDPAMPGDDTDGTDGDTGGTGGDDGTDDGDDEGEETPGRSPKPKPAKPEKAPKPQEPDDDEEEEDEEEDDDDAGGTDVTPPGHDKVKGPATGKLKKPKTN